MSTFFVLSKKFNNDYPIDRKLKKKYYTNFCLGSIDPPRARGMVGNFHYEGIYRCSAGRGILFRPPNIWMGIKEWKIQFHIKSISMGYLFHPKGIWMGKIWKIVYEWVPFLIWDVYEWVCFLTSPSIWMGWGLGTPAARPYLKSWQVDNPPTPPPRPRA